MDSKGNWGVEQSTRRSVSARVSYDQLQEQGLYAAQELEMAVAWTCTLQAAYKHPELASCPLVPPPPKYPWSNQPWSYKPYRGFSLWRYHSREDVRSSPCMVTVSLCRKQKA